MPESIQLYTGVCAEAQAALAHALASAPGAPACTVVLTAEPAGALRLASELKTYAAWAGKPERTLLFPEAPPPDIDPQRRQDRIHERLAVLSALLSDSTRTLLVATPEALLGPCPERTAFESRQIELRVGQRTNFGELVTQLTGNLNYDAEALCEHPGQVATRGGLIDVYPCDAREPFRIDFFGDEIESIRAFDPTTQRSGEARDCLRIPSAAKLDASGEKPGGLDDYLPEDPVQWVSVEPALLVRQHPYRYETNPPAGKGLQTFHQLSGQRRQAGDLHHGLCLLDTEPGLFNGAPRRALRTEATDHYRFHLESAQIGADRFESERDARTRFEAQLAEWAGPEDLDLIFVTPGPAEASRIMELLADNPLTAKLSPRFLHGAVGAGFIYQSSGLPRGQDPLARSPLTGTSQKKPRFVLVTDSEFFGRSPRRLDPINERARPAISQIEQLLDFTELADGDHLVHLQHGICIFRGLTRIEIQGGAKEVISVEFAEQMTLHVPLHESHLLTRYVGLNKTRPKLGKIGSSSWEKTRRAAERATLDYAAEMLRLHALRSQGGGRAFPPDHPWQREFESAFPFKETPDQLRAIEATKADMERPEPMDRLICGDVGFGKTEVAIRAAFKAALAGKQVAVLAPTTVLCQQHLNTFRERMAPYPVTVEMVSGFRSPRQNKEVIAQLAGGAIDIVVGTHRLLSRDVHFRDLGLLIIDEEQRFGVRQKEAIKRLRADVDILTLSATPIPRTLYLALAGAREMSVIETPPIDRKPIETIVRSYDEALIRQAIQAETDRGGQVFYLHNRVATIEGVANRIREMHPCLRVAVGHGQMDEGALEKIMTRFVAGEYDVLVCTTIIESGIDIPNCNTLIIEGADRFGLAQLYQIRGRVGRFKRQAYAYLLLHRHAALVDQAQKRLNALKQHNQLGAGFRIAMRDLELRGAGNLLGAQQSGHIAGIGFELYCQLLQQSVARLKGEPGADRIRAEVKLDFIASGEGGGRSRQTSGSFSFAAIKDAEYTKHSDVIEATLPADYLAEPRLRIDVYRRLALAHSVEAVHSIRDELLDRFGPLPRATLALLAVSEIRVRAELADVSRVESERDRLICHLARSTPGKEFLKSGSRFPRLSARDPLKRLEEIRRYLSKQTKSREKQPTGV